CKDTAHPLANVTVKSMTILNTNVPGLEASIDPALGFSSTPLFLGTNLTAPPNIVIDAGGHAALNLRVRSDQKPNLLGADDTPKPIGLYYDFGSGPLIIGDGDPSLLSGGRVFASTPE